MPRLPKPGKDAGTWGDLLNDFLAQEHDADGSLKRGPEIDQATSDIAQLQTDTTDLQTTKADQTTVDDLTPGAGKVVVGGAHGPVARIAKYDQVLRRSGPDLYFRNTKEAYLNDRNDIDATGGSDMGPVISAYLAEFATLGVRHIYCEPGSTYLVNTAIEVPAYVTLGGPMRMDQGSSSAHKATFKAAADGITMIRLAGNYANLVGLNISLAYKNNVIGVRPNRHVQLIEGCLFGGCSASSTAVQGGGILYFAMRDNVFSDGFYGRAVDLLDAYADDPAVVYYGVNVGWFEHNIFAGPQGAFRAEGIFTVRDNDFEGGSGSVGPALEVSCASVGSSYQIEGNYFEMSGASQGILLGTAASGTITGNTLYGSQSAVGGYGIKAQSYLYNLVCKGNGINRFETGIDLRGGPTETHAPGWDIVGNTIAYCTTSMTGGPTGRVVGAYAGGDGAVALVQRGDGRLTQKGAIVGGIVYWTDAYGADLDLRQGNTFHLSFTSPVTLTIAKGASGYGQLITLICLNAQCTLTNSIWHPIEGVDVALQKGEVRQFIADYYGNLHEVLSYGMAPTLKHTGALAGFFGATPVPRPAAITGATTDDKLNDLIAKLQALGLIS